jgi:diguanylate cyclase (GGDEF)-like protein
MAAQRAAIAFFRPEAHLDSVAVVAVQPTEAPGARRMLGLGGLKPTAAAFLAATVLGAAALGAGVLTRLSFDAAHWGTFALLLGLATVAQLFIVEKPGGQSYRTAIVFIIAAAILLPAPFVVLLSAAHYVPSWFRHKKKNVVRVFNVANTSIAALAAWAAFHSLRHSDDIRYIVAGAAACLAFVAVIHVILALMLHFNSGKSLWETGLFSFESLSTDFALAALGVGVSVAWEVNPWSIVFVVMPLLLIHRSLHVPQLQEEARIDPKTGLLNAREYEISLDDELDRAARTGAPLSVLMTDLDLLRDINNNFGHLAGDAVIRGIAGVIRGELRRYDIAARFGGEEFSVLLPSTAPEQALEIAERIRRAVEVARFEEETVSEPLSATLSIGVAAYPRDALEAKGLVHAADIAVYEAKARGRNRVVDVAAVSAEARAAVVAR